MKKLLKRMFSIAITAAMTFNMFAPLSVLAAGVTYTLTFNAQGDHTLAVDGGHLKIDGEFVDLKDGDNAIGDVACESNKKCTITVTNGPAGELNYNSADKFTIKVGQDSYTIGTALSADTQLAVVDFEDDEGFDGETYLVWSCSLGLCHHHFSDFPVDENGTFIFQNEILDDADPTVHFDVHADVKFFSAGQKFNDYMAAHGINSIDQFRALNPSSLVGVDGIDYQPVNEPTYNNAYVSYADRNFKAIIYNSDFKALKIGDLSELNYYPGAWKNKLTRMEAFDISGTTKDAPVDINTVLLESTIVLSPHALNNLTIKSIEALDVPQNAVTITKNNDGSYKFVFASRFYDKVVFKLTDNDNKEYFFRIKREAFSIERAGVNPEGTFELRGTVYFDRTTSWEDYIVTAKVQYKDKSTKIVNLVNAKFIDDGLLNIAEVYENDEEEPALEIYPKGKGLKRGTYDLQLENAKTIDSVYINIEYKGSTKDIYKGTYMGSGKGELIKVSDYIREENA